MKIATQPRARSRLILYDIYLAACPIGAMVDSVFNGALFGFWNKYKYIVTIALILLNYCSKSGKFSMSEISNIENAHVEILPKNLD